MTPDKYQRLKLLFEEALDTPPEQRAALLLKIRAADEELGRELESLIASHDAESHELEPAGDNRTASQNMTRSMEPLVRLHEVFPSHTPSFATDEMLLGRFRIVRFIGRGGMGEVYEAEDLQLGRVALKTIRTDLTGKSQMLARFRQEVQLARRVTSTGVCRIHELFPMPAGERGGAAAFLTMEFLEGITLADRIDLDGPLPFAEAESLALQLCAALQAIHDAGVIHRDIKSRNVMLVPRNGAVQAVVMDLGLAGESSPQPESDNGLTMAGAVMGTPQNMAPEQFEGAQATPATDIYALGILFYEMLTGKAPFHGSTPMAAAVLRGKHRPPASSLRQNLPRRWDFVINRCLQFDAGLRYQSANQVADALRGRKAHRAGRVAAYAAAAVLVAAAAAGIARSPLMNHVSLHGNSSVAEAKTMVVLPFENLAGDAASQAFCDGLQETMTSMLSQADKLRNSILVVPTSELRRNQVKTLADARKVFNAGLALTGSVQKNAGALQVTLNLTDAQSLRQRDSRILLVKPDEMAALPQRLADQIDSLLGAGSVLRVPEAGPGATTRDPDAYKFYIQGLGALQSRKLDEAVDNLQKAVTKDPEFTAAAAKLAEACVRNYLVNKDTKWLARADSALNGANGSRQAPEGLLAQAMIWQATGENDKAAPLLRQLLQTEPNNVDVWDMLAQTLQAAGKNTEAEETYQTAIRLRPGYWPVYNKMAIFYMDQHQYQKAEQAFLAGIGVAPEVAGLHSNLGALYFNLSRWDDAGREFRKSLALRPYAPGFLNLGTVLFFQGKYAEAARQCEKAIELQPSNPLNWGNLGDARWQLKGERDHARDAYTKAALLAGQQLVVNPADARLRRNYALYLAKLGQIPDATREIETAIRQAPGDMYVRFYAARVYAVEGNLTRALSEIRVCLTLGYDSQEIEREPDLAPLRRDPRYQELKVARK